ALNAAYDRNSNRPDWRRLKAGQFVSSFNQSLLINTPEIKRRALVTGAGGAIGATLVQRLVEKGYAVRALLHSAKTGAALPESVEIIYGDITDCGLVREAVGGMDVVLHLAANVH